MSRAHLCVDREALRDDGDVPARMTLGVAYELQIVVLVAVVVPVHKVQHISPRLLDRPLRERLRS